MSKSRIDYKEINTRALPYAEEIFEEIGLGGEMQGKEYVCLNPKRDDTELGSFKFNTETGAWADFADDDANGIGVISYVAYVNDCTPKQSATMLQTWLDTDVENPPPVSNHQDEKAAPDDSWKIVQPVPSDAPPAPQWFGKRLGTPAMAFEYKNESGHLLGGILRFDTAKGKTILPLTLWLDEAAKMQWRLKGFPVPRC